MLDPSGLHGAGPLTNGRWMDEQEIGLQLQLGREGHCVLWALGGLLADGWGDCGSRAQGRADGSS